MAYIYNYKELETKEDYINQLKEIEAYRELDGQPFDFGTGLITSEFSLGSEDAYYEMDIYSLEGAIEFWDEPKSNKKKQRENKYARNRKHKDKLNKMRMCDWYPVWNNGSVYRNDNRYPKRYYRGKRSKILKIQSNRKIRKYKGNFQKKGSKFHRVFDFWWEMY